MKASNHMFKDRGESDNDGGIKADPLITCQSNGGKKINQISPVQTFSCHLQMISRSQWEGVQFCPKLFRMRKTQKKLLASA